MLRSPAILLGTLLAASPAAALSVSVAACNEHSAELVADGRDATLTVDEVEVPLEPGADYEDLLCVERDGRTLFGLIQLSEEGDETYFLLDPESLELAQIPYEEAEALEFWDTEDDWFEDDDWSEDD